jgi:NADH dehydrogenase (ubiquinone) Fe-S protein 3
MFKKNFIKKFKGIIPYISYQNINKESILIFSKNYLLVNFYILKNQIQYQYNLLSCISGVDLISNHYRFCLSYELLSVVYNTRLRIKIFINEISTVPSIYSIFINSNWWEREVWDLFGVYFTNHPDLRRILTDYGFEGHPLRKDFPLSGYIELRYDIITKRMVSEPLELAQEFRSFTFEMPW